jgi:hypothetical protein
MTCGEIQPLVLTANAAVLAPAAPGGEPAGAVTPVRLDADEVARRLAWQDGLLAFNGESLAQAAGEFARYSSTRIVIDDPALADEPLTGLYASSDPEGFARLRPCRWARAPWPPMALFASFDRPHLQKNLPFPGGKAAPGASMPTTTMGERPDQGGTMKPYSRVFAACRWPRCWRRPARRLRSGRSTSRPDWRPIPFRSSRARPACRSSLRPVG